VLANSRPRVVIIGAGFGGLWAARRLANAPADVFVIDRNNYHSFFPLLYQVAAAELEPEDIIYPVRSILHKYPNLHFILGDVVAIDHEYKLIRTREQRVSYDYLILSAGSKPHFFGVSGAMQYSFPLRTLDDAVRLRNQILCRFEAAAVEPDQTIRKQMLTFTIVGGGPTGVEFAGALAELVRKPLARDYPNLVANDVHILLLEASDRLFAGMPERLHNFTFKRFQRMGIDVKLNSTVDRITPSCVMMKDGWEIPSDTVVWTAGVGGISLPQGWDYPTRANGQVDVLETLQVPGHPEIYITGDLAHVEQAGRQLLLVATVAIQEGEWAAKNILRQLDGKEPIAFEYHDPGLLAVTGRNAAVVRIGKVTLTGFPAWIIWVTVHLYRLIGFRNRLVVFINWAWDYIFFDRVVRLIFPRTVNELSEQGCGS
jgi:NADH:quinone reductase (non-electrogenic)